MELEPTSRLDRAFPRRNLSDGESQREIELEIASVHFWKKFLITEEYCSTIHIANVTFAWNVGQSTCVRFETICRCWHLGSLLLDSRNPSLRYLKIAFYCFRECEYQLLLWRINRPRFFISVRACQRKKLECLLEFQAKVILISRLPIKQISENCLWLFVICRKFNVRRDWKQFSATALFSYEAMLANENKDCERARAFAERAVSSGGYLPNVEASLQQILAKKGSSPKKGTKLTVATTKGTVSCHFFQ